ncbi:MAG: hypothetical protein RR131_03290 [Anaerovorax sp.]
MKQIIVMVAMIILGVAIAGFVLGFEDTAKSIASNATSKITTSAISK